MTGKKKNNKTGLAGFLRYRKKGMSGEERNAFERELHKDPFAEEAEEGLSSYDPEMIRKDMDSLRKRLSSRTGSRQRAIILRIAASVAILMVLTSVLIILERSRSSINQVSGEKTQIAFNIESRSPVFEKENVIPSGEPARSGEQKKSIQQMTVPEPQTKSADKKAEKVEGQGEEKEKDYIGIVDQKDTISEPVQEPVALAADEALVSEYGEKRAAARNVTAAAAKAELNRKVAYTEYTPPSPVNGKDNFNRYIESNIHVPDTLIVDQKAVVLLSFIVKTSGAIDSIKILKSPGAYYSNEAIRLIKEGPRWKAASENGVARDEEVRLSIVFK